MAEFIEFLSSNALKELELANKELVTMVANVDNVGKKMKNISTPSGSDSAIKSLTDQYKQQEKVIQSLQNQLQKLTEKQNQNTNSKKQEVQAILDQSKSYQSLSAQKERAIKQAEREKIANDKLNSAYLQLSQKQAESARKVQDLIARGKSATQTQSQYTKELKTAQREFDNYNKKVLNADRAVGKFNRNVGNYPKQALSGLGNLMGAFGIVGGVSLFATVATDIFNTTKELQSLDNALKQVSGTQEQFSSSQAFLREISETFGLEINGLTKQFTQFYVSAKDKISGKEIEDIFTSVAKAGAVMGLSVDNQNRAFLALNQMMSKGVVSAEELRGQLGEALPGAFGIMAKALNVNEQQLGKLMKDGKLLASEVLPKFAQALEKVYGIETIDRVETLSASQNRLSNSWTELVRSLNESETGGISIFFKSLVDGLNTVLKLITEANKSFSDFKKAVYSENKSNKASFVEQMADDSAKAIIEGQIRRGEKPSNYEELKRIKLIEIASAELVRQKSAYIQALKDEESAEIALNIQKEKSESLITGGIFNLSSLNKAEKKHQEAILRTQEIRGNIDGLTAITNKKTEESTKLVIENTTATTKNTKAKKEEEILIIGSEKWLNNQISQIRELNATLSTTSKEYQVGVGAIKFYEQWLERLTGTAKKTKEELDGVSLDLGGSEFLTDEDGDALMKAGEELRALLKEFKQGFIDDFSNQSGFSGILDILSGGLDKFEGDAVSTALAVSEAFQQAFNTISEMSNANYENMYRNLEQQRDVAILFAGESTTAREEIERQYEERRRKIQRQQAESQKRLAMFNIVTDTAQAILATFAKSGFPAGVPLAIAMGAIGAVQLAMVASQPIPAFEKGGIHDGGLMLVNDGKGSNYAEKVVTPDGKVHEPKGRNVVMNAPKGTQIFTHDQWQDQMNNILLGNGIQGINQRENTNNIIVNVETKDNYDFRIDECGIKKTIMRGTAQTQILNSRLRIKSKDV
jgi:tape measure domain-containing protein